MNRNARSPVLAAALLAGAAFAAAQEKPAPPPPTAPPPQGAREEKPEKVWTNEDLKDLPPGGVSVLGARIIAPAAPATAGRGESWWRTQYRLVRERIETYEKLQGNLDQQVGFASNPYTRATVRSETGEILDLASLRARQEEVRKSLEASRKALADLDESARREAVPRAWRDPAPLPEPQPGPPAPPKP